MNLLIVIPHYYKYAPNSPLASEAQSAEKKLTAIRCMLTALKEQFEAPHAYRRWGSQTTTCPLWDEATGTMTEKTMASYHTLSQCADAALRHTVDIVFCTNRQDHLIPQLDIHRYPGVYHAVTAVENPRYLGFVAQNLLTRTFRKNSYDYYAYMEDDLILHDPLFFDKLRWFSQTFGEDKILMPHRYSCTEDRKFAKIYIDPEYDESLMVGEFSVLKRLTALTRKYNHAEQEPVLKASCLGREIVFRKPMNLHAGCFFLTAGQFERFAARPDFAKPNQWWFDPLVSAATGDILRLFSIYKPDFSNAAFFEVEHGVDTGTNDDLCPGGHELQLDINLKSFAAAGCDTDFWQHLHETRI